MHRLERIIGMIDNILDTKKKQHIAGGILISIALLCGGLGVTVLTLKEEEKNDEQYIE